MMSTDSMQETIRAIEAQGYSRAEAMCLAILMGDVIEEENGKWIIRDEKGKVVARIDPLIDQDVPAEA